MAYIPKTTFATAIHTQDTNSITTGTMDRGRLPSGAHAVLSLTGNATTALNVGVPRKMQGTTSAGSMTAFSMASNNRITYTGTDSINALVGVVISASFSAPLATVHMLVAKDGSVISASNVERYIAAGGDQGAWATAYVVSLDTNAFLEPWIGSDTQGTATVYHCILTASEVGAGS